MLDRVAAGRRPRRGPARCRRSPENSLTPTRLSQSNAGRVNDGNLKAGGAGGAVGEGATGRAGVAADAAGVIGGVVGMAAGVGADGCGGGAGAGAGGGGIRGGSTLTTGATGAGCRPEGLHLGRGRGRVRPPDLPNQQIIVCSRSPILPSSASTLFRVRFERTRLTIGSTMGRATRQGR